MRACLRLRSKGRKVPRAPDRSAPAISDGASYRSNIERTLGRSGPAPAGKSQPKSANLGRMEAPTAHSMGICYALSSTGPFAVIQHAMPNGVVRFLLYLQHHAPRVP